MSRPPALARLLVRLLPLGRRRTDVLDDLEQIYRRYLRDDGRRSARRRYRREVGALARYAFGAGIDKLAGRQTIRRDTASRQFLPGAGTRRLRRAAAQRFTAGRPSDSLTPPPDPRENPMLGFLQDIRYGLRSLRRKPAYTVLALSTLAVGIGAVTVMFTLVQGVLFAPLPVRDPDRLMIVWETSPRSAQTIASAANYNDWRQRNDVFENLALTSFWGPTLSGVDEPRRLSGGEVSANFLATIGVEPLLGRDFRPDEDDPGADPVVLLSEGLWREAFGADPDIAGTDITLSTGRHTVIGVAPATLGRAGFGYDLLIPVILEEGDWLQFRGRHSVTVVGRLAEGVTEEAAQAQMSRIAATLATEYPETNEGYGVDVEPMKAALTDTAEQPLTMLLAAVGLVLLIACANVANLALARAVGSRAELAVRAALGAGRWRLFQRLAVEGGLLAVLGGLLGVVSAYALLDIVVAFVPSSVPRLGEVSMNAVVLAFGAAATALTLLIAGALPAVSASKTGIAAALSVADPHATIGRGERWKRNGLVVVEMALAVVLLVGAGLFLRSLGALATVELGVDPRNVMTVRTYLPGDAYTESARARSLLDAILDDARRLPGADSVSITSHLPLANQGMTSSVRIFGQEDTGPDGPSASFRIVSPGYFDVLGIAVLRGRDVRDDDAIGQPLVVLVNQEFADRYLADSAADGAVDGSATDAVLGRRISYRLDDDGNRRYAEIVGIVGNVHHFGPAQPPVPEVYEPLGQAEETLRWVGRSFALVARASADAPPLGPALRSLIRRADPNLPVYQVQPLDTFLAAGAARPRFRARLLSLFGALAVALAGIGVYGVLSLQVRSRAREIGLRQALGADRGNVVRGVVSTGLKLAALGAVVGLAAALALARFVSSLLFGVGAFDPPVLIATPLLLAAVAALACWLPAVRAARVDPAIALRDS